jgi:hypothetical protein
MKKAIAISQILLLPTIIACITQPMTIGAVSIIGFTIMILVGIVDTKTAVQGFGNSIFFPNNLTNCRAIRRPSPVFTNPLEMKKAIAISQILLLPFTCWC